MTVHAGLGGRQTGKGRVFDGGVAVTTVDAIIADVMLVTERDGLLHRVADARDIRRAKHQSADREQPRDNERTSKDAHARNGVRAAMKDLRHDALGWDAGWALQLVLYYRST